MGTVEIRDGLEVRAFASAADFERWLAARHESSPGLWLKIAKKGAGIPSVTYSEALDVALCFGWIDGQKGRYDDTAFVQRFTPRRPRSKWSRANVERVRALTAAGRMRPAGQAAVAAAQADGRWEAAYPSHSTATVPDDLLAALDANPAARELFATLSSQNRYAILYRVHDAKRPETRARRIEKYVAMLAEGRTPY